MEPAIFSNPLRKCAALFTAMFDEVDEGTAMFKAAANQDVTPSSGSFLTLDADVRQSVRGGSIPCWAPAAAM